MRVLVIGDIHGGYKALIQCLERSNFDYENDQLISLGDICDGWNEVYECVEELIKIKNLIVIEGNHDSTFIEWMTRGKHPWHWLQGGHATLESYVKHAEKYRTMYIDHVMGGYESNLATFDIPDKHRDFFYNMKPYYVDKDNNLFVHGGFNRHFQITDSIYNGKDILMWDRDLWSSALSFHAMSKRSTDVKYPFKMKDDFNHVYIGHTTTLNWDTDLPMTAVNITNLDTGGGFKGKLTIMDLNTKEYWQSDNVNVLYKDQKGRN